MACPCIRAADVPKKYIGVIHQQTTGQPTGEEPGRLGLHALRLHLVM
jgi:hypothetical protein